MALPKDGRMLLSLLIIDFVIYNFNTHEYREPLLRANSEFDIQHSTQQAYVLHNSL